MTAGPLTSEKHKTYLGGGLVLAGLLALQANLAFWGAPLANLIESSKLGLAGLLSLSGFYVLHAAGNIVFGQVDYFSLASRILLLFCAMVALIAGLVLMSSASATRGSNPLSSSSLTREETE